MLTTITRKTIATTTMNNNNNNKVRLLHLRSNENQLKLIVSKVKLKGGGL